MKTHIRGLVALTVVTLTVAYVSAQNQNQNPPPQQPAQQNPVGQQPQYPPAQQPQNPYPNNPPAQAPTQNPAHQQPNVQGQVNTQTSSGMVARRMKQVIGGRVSIQGGTSVGVVDDIVFNDNGCIDYVVVMDQGRYVFMPWTAAQFNFDQRAATVNITQEKWREVPTYTAQNYATVNVYEPAFQQKIYGYYGVQVPTRHDVRQDQRQDRRDDRRR